MTQQRLQELFNYHLDGYFIAKVSRKHCPVGKRVAGWPHPICGYSQLTVDCKLYTLHRLVFLFHNGFLPEEVDHINGNRLDNRIENLRAATRQKNQRNRGKCYHNTSGYKGVYRMRNRWQARAHVAGKPYYIGSYLTAEEAARAYNMIVARYDGEFAWLNSL